MTMTCIILRQKSSTRVIDLRMSRLKISQQSCPDLKSNVLPLILRCFLLMISRKKFLFLALLFSHFYVYTFEMSTNRTRFKRRPEDAGPNQNKNKFQKSDKIRQIKR